MEERRGRIRFPLKCPVEWHLIANGHSARGRGETSNISSKGICLEGLNGAFKDAKPGEWVELCIQWPALLEDGHPLNLKVKGRLCWLSSTNQRAGLTLEQYGFYTRKTSSAGG